MRTRSSSPAPSGPGLSQIEFEMPSLSEIVHQAGAAERSQRFGREPELRARCGSEVGDGSGVSEAVRRLQVDEVRDRQERGVELLLRETHRERRLGIDHGVPRPD